MRQREMKLKFLLEEALYLNMVGKCFYTLTCIIFDLVEWSMAFPFLDVQLVLRLLNYDIELRKKKTKVITYYILGQIYYILRYFGFLHFASKVITFWVTITFWVNYSILWRNIPAFDQSVSLISRANSVSLHILLSRVPCE